MSNEEMQELFECFLKEKNLFNDFVSNCGGSFGYKETINNTSIDMSWYSIIRCAFTWRDFEGEKTWIELHFEWVDFIEGVEYMNFKDLKQWQQLDAEIEYWEGIVKNDGIADECFPLCHKYNMTVDCNGCPLRSFIGSNCSNGTPYSEWLRCGDKETAQAMVDRLKEIRYRLFRLDR